MTIPTHISIPPRPHEYRALAYPPPPGWCASRHAIAVSACGSRTYVNSVHAYSVRGGTPRYRAKKWYGKLFFRDLLARLPASQKETCQNLVWNEYILCVLWHACYTLWYMAYTHCGTRFVCPVGLSRRLLSRLSRRVILSLCPAFVPSM